MARKRFGDLERIYDALKLGNVQIASLPQNLDFVKHGKWKEGNGPERNIVRPNTQGEKEVGIVAFGLPSTNQKGKIIVPISGRSLAFLDAAKQTALGIQDNPIPATGPSEYATNGSFVPAKVSIGVLGASTSKTSDITGRRYKSKVTASYSAPFGQTTANKHYQEQVNAIIAAYRPTSADAADTHTLSFQPEQWRRD